MACCAGCGCRIQQAYTTCIHVVMSDTWALSNFALSPLPSFSSDDHLRMLSVNHVSGGTARASVDSMRASSAGPHGSSDTYPRGMRG